MLPFLFLVLVLNFLMNDFNIYGRIKTFECIAVNCETSKQKKYKFCSRKHFESAPKMSCHINSFKYYEV